MHTNPKPEIFDNLKAPGLDIDDAVLAASLHKLFDHLGPEKTFALVVLGMVEQVDLAKALGRDEGTVRNWVAARAVPFVRLGNKNVFLVASMREWLRSKETKPVGSH